MSRIILINNFKVSIDKKLIYIDRYIDIVIYPQHATHDPENGFN